MEFHADINFLCSVYIDKTNIDNLIVLMYSDR